MIIHRTKVARTKQTQGPFRKGSIRAKRGGPSAHSAREEGGSRIGHRHRGGAWPSGGWDRSKEVGGEGRTGWRGPRHARGTRTPMRRDQGRSSWGGEAVNPCAESKNGYSGNNFFPQDRNNAKKVTKNYEILKWSPKKNLKHITAIMCVCMYVCIKRKILNQNGNVQ